MEGGRLVLEGVDNATASLPALRCTPRARDANSTSAKKKSRIDLFYHGYGDPSGRYRSNGGPLPVQKPRYKNVEPEAEGPLRSQARTYYLPPDPAPPPPPPPHFPRQPPSRVPSHGHCQPPERNVHAMPRSLPSDPLLYAQLSNPQPPQASASSAGMCSTEDRKYPAILLPEPSPDISKKTKSGTAESDKVSKSSRSSHAKSEQSRVGGCQLGSSNYSEADVRQLLKIVHRLLPSVHSRGQQEAHQWAEVPWYIEEAMEIQFCIDGKVGVQELDDSQTRWNLARKIQDNSEEEARDVEAGPVSSSDEVEIVEQPTKSSTHSKSTTLSSSVGPASDRSSGPHRRHTQTQQFLSMISACLDPSARKARDEARYSRRLAQDEINRLAQENRDLRTWIEALMDRNQSLTLQLQQQTAERTRLQSRLDMYDMMTAMMGHHSMPRPPPDHHRSASLPPFPWFAARQESAEQLHPTSPTAGPSCASAAHTVPRHPPTHPFRPQTPDNSGLVTLVSITLSSRRAANREIQSTSVTVTVMPTCRRTANFVEDDDMYRDD
ncbi:hypothetical protein BV20DRAFT_982924 [Pilatotrama ljubarskyi]|nr:hypothetical protein BV20DRAFT_982924 [Pilatotrama ljubarskyi]